VAKRVCKKRGLKIDLTLVLVSKRRKREENKRSQEQIRNNNGEGHIIYKKKNPGHKIAAHSSGIRPITSAMGNGIYICYLMLCKKAFFS
jgi:hypothetical protein